MVHTTCQHSCSNGCVVVHCYLLACRDGCVKCIHACCVKSDFALILCVDFISRYFHPVISAFDIFSKKCTHVYRHIHELNIYVKCLCIQNVPALVCVCTFQVCMVFSTFPLCHAEWPLSVLTWHITELRLELMCVYNTSADNMHTSKHENMPDTVHTERERGRQALTGMLKIVLTMCTDHVRCSVSCSCLPFVVFMNVRMWNSFATALHSAYLMRSCDSCSATLQPCPATLSPYVCGICKNSFIT